MIRRIRLTNYMSHADSVIELADGLTVLVGPNNCGKSAVVSALETLCRNASGDYMVRHEENEARVTVETDDGHVFVWRRKGKTVSYVIDGREIHRVSRGIPDDLHHFLRLPLVGEDDFERFEIHFGTQKSPIFLLNEPESRAARFFASSSDAATLLKMQQRHREKVRDRAAEEKSLNKDIARLNLELAALAPVDQLASDVSQLEREHGDCARLDQQIPLLHQAIQDLRSRQREHRQIERKAGCLAGLATPPNLPALEPLEQLLQDLHFGSEQNLYDGRQVNAIQRLRNVPILDDDAALAEAITKLRDAHAKQKHWQQHSLALHSLQPVPTLADESHLEHLCQQLAAAVRLHGRASVVIRRLSGLEAPPTLEPVAQLEPLVRSLNRAHHGWVYQQQIHEAIASLRDVPIFPETKPFEQLIEDTQITTKTIDEMQRIIQSRDKELDHLGASIQAADQTPFVADTIVEQPAAGRRVAIWGSVALVGVAGLLLAVYGILYGQGSRHQPAPVALIANNSPPPDVRVETEPDKPRVVVESPPPKPPEVVKQPIAPPPLAPSMPPPAMPAVNDHRLAELRQLLHGADQALADGQLLDAIAGYGRAALSYSQELPKVRKPDLVKGQFLHAVRRLQAEVEKALNPDRDPEPREKKD